MPRDLFPREDGGMSRTKKAMPNSNQRTQPAHHAQVLGVLATIELKPILLREELFVEEEGSLVWDGLLLRMVRTLSGLYVLPFILDV